MTDCPPCVGVASTEVGFIPGYGNQGGQGAHGNNGEPINIILPPPSSADMQSSQWARATLQHAWQSYQPTPDDAEFGYRLEGRKLCLRGMLTRGAGTISLPSVVTQLPDGFFDPGGRETIAAYVWDVSSDLASSLGAAIFDITEEGELRYIFGPTTVTGHAIVGLQNHQVGVVVEAVPPTSGWSYERLLELEDSYQDVLDDFATYQDLLEGP